VAEEVRVSWLALVDGVLAAGVERLVLRTRNRQPETITLYEREGWSAVPIHPPYDIAPRSRCYARDL
jgi:hypothetical protein